MSSQVLRAGLMSVRSLSHGIWIDDALIYLAQPLTRCHRRSDLGIIRTKEVTFVWEKSEDDALSIL